MVDRQRKAGVRHLRAFGPREQQAQCRPPGGKNGSPAAFVLAEREETREENQIKDDPKKIAGNGASAAHKNGTLRLMTHP